MRTDKIRNNTFSSETASVGSNLQCVHASTIACKTGWVSASCWQANASTALSATAVIGPALNRLID